MSANPDSSQAGLHTSIYFKTRPGAPPEDEECYYLVTRSGLFIGRNTPLLRSLVPSRSWPSELQDQDPFLFLSYPKVPADLLARITGFFWVMAQRHGAEAVVLLGLDEATGRIEALVPPQLSTVGLTYHGDPYPIRLRYNVPHLHGRGLKLIGDIHSHVFEPAYASSIDISDERHRPGLHLVAGRVDRDPPQWHGEMVVDGARFHVAPEQVLDLESYDRRCETVDDSWLESVRVKTIDHYARGRNDNAGPGP